MRFPLNQVLRLFSSQQWKTGRRENIFLIQKGVYRTGNFAKELFKTQKDNEKLS